MKWRGREKSTNVNDRRGQSGGMPNFGGFKMGTGGVILLLVL